jgi:hypothetical protein
MRISHLGQYGPQGQFLGPVAANYAGFGPSQQQQAAQAAQAALNAQAPLSTSQVSTTEAPAFTVIYSGPSSPAAPTGTLGPLVVPGPVIPGSANGPASGTLQPVATVPGSTPIPGLPVLSTSNIVQPFPDITATLAPLPPQPSLWCDVNVWIGDNSLLAVGLLAGAAFLLWPRGKR